MKRRRKNIIETRKKYYPFELKKYLTLRNLLIVLVLVAFNILFPRFFQPIVLVLLFYPLSLISIRTTKYIKHLNTELLTPFTIFLGYLYGWKWAFFFGFVLGLYMWSQTALNQLTFVNCVTYIYAAFLGEWAAVWFPGNFVVGYLVAVTIRNILTFFTFLFLNPSIVENITHTISAMITNTLLAPIFLNLLYKLIMFLTPS